MNILYIIPGSGDQFYCGNCLRDSKYVSAIRELGHDVIKIPMYLPLFSEEKDRKDTPLFYNAISIYMKQRYPFFRKAPRWLDHLMSSRALLKLAAGMSGSTNAKGLGELTVSMLMGEKGVQSGELDEMVEWIATHSKPDIVHLSNALLLGLAHQLRERLRIPVVCTLQDEDVWVDVLKPWFRERAWDLMREDAVNIDSFVAVSDFYGDLMQKKLDLPAEKVGRIHLGICLKDYPDPFSSGNPAPGITDRRAIGYISRMNHENGFDILVDAFILLKKKQKFSDVRLVATGGHTSYDHRYLKRNKKKLLKAGLLQDVDFHEDFVDEGRFSFFQKISALTVPVRQGEAFGLYLIESMASGVPVVQPALGAFPEIVGLADAGLIYDKNTPAELAESLALLLDDPELLREKSMNARKGAEEYFNIRVQAGKLVEHYESLSLIK